MSKKLNKKILVKVAKELNGVMGLDPEIEIDGDEKSILKQIEENVSEIEPEDKWSTKTEQFLKEQGYIDSDEEENGDNDDEIEEDDTEVKKSKAVKKSTKKKSKKAVTKKEKKTGTKKAVKRAVKKTAKKMVKKSTKKKITKSNKPKSFIYTRSHALVDALKKGGTKEQMIKNASILYVKKGGADNENVAKALLGYVLPSLIIIKFVTKNNNKYSLS